MSQAGGIKTPNTAGWIHKTDYAGMNEEETESGVSAGKEEVF